MRASGESCPPRPTTVTESGRGGWPEASVTPWLRFYPGSSTGVLEDGAVPVDPRLLSATPVQAGGGGIYHPDEPCVSRRR